MRILFDSELCRNSDFCEMDTVPYFPYVKLQIKNLGKKGGKTFKLKSLKTIKEGTQITESN